MNGRVTLYLLLLVVAGAAAMLSFVVLRDLALLCGFAPVLTWLLPVVVDAGAAAGSLVWLGTRTGEPARRFARRLALGLLGLSVAANALGHGLAAYGLRPPWWVVVLLSGIAPAVLGAMVHLAVLVGRSDDSELDDDVVEPALTEFAGPSTNEVEPEPSVSACAENVVEFDTLPADEPTAEPDEPAAMQLPAGLRADRDPAAAVDPAAVLIAAGAGRRRLSRELGLTEYEARRLLERTRGEADTVEAGVRA